MTLPTDVKKLTPAPGHASAPAAHIEEVAPATQQHSDVNQGTVDQSSVDDSTVNTVTNDDKDIARTHGAEPIPIPLPDNAPPPLSYHQDSDTVTVLLDVKAKQESVKITFHAVEFGPIVTHYCEIAYIPDSDGHDQAKYYVKFDAALDTEKSSVDVSQHNICLIFIKVGCELLYADGSHLLTLLTGPAVAMAAFYRGHVAAGPRRVRVHHQPIGLMLVCDICALT